MFSVLRSHEMLSRGGLLFLLACTRVSIVLLLQSNHYPTVYRPFVRFYLSNRMSNQRISSPAATQLGFINPKRPWSKSKLTCFGGFPSGVCRTSCLPTLSHNHPNTGQSSSAPVRINIGNRETHRQLVICLRETRPMLTQVFTGLKN